MGSSHLACQDTVASLVEPYKWMKAAVEVAQEVDEHLNKLL
jgi:hypothetical protein